jgi:uncharacterized small protein (DUF1192 family)
MGAIALDKNKELDETIRILREEISELIAELDEPIVRIPHK